MAIPGPPAGTVVYDVMCRHMCGPKECTLQDAYAPKPDQQGVNQVDSNLRPACDMQCHPWAWVLGGDCYSTTPSTLTPGLLPLCYPLPDLLFHQLFTWLTSLSISSACSNFTFFFVILIFNCGKIHTNSLLTSFKYTFLGHYVHTHWAPFTILISRTPFILQNWNCILMKQ